MFRSLATRTLVALLCCAPALALRASAQQPAVTPRDSATATDAIKVYLDCRGDTSQGCSQEFFVTEMPYVSWTRDRLFADVQFLVTTIQTGSGAYQYTVGALGRGRFDGRDFNGTVNVRTGVVSNWSLSPLGGTFMTDPANPSLVMVARVGRTKP